MNLEELKFKLYELSVQSPNWQVDYLPQFHRWLTGKNPKSFREDFCGSGKIACEWVKKSSTHTAMGLDIDSFALNYAMNVNQAELTQSQKRRVHFKNQDVLKPTREKFDWIGAFNFSYYIFHERKELLRYARSAFQSLNKKGTLFLEVAGGSGFKEPLIDTKTLKVPGLGKIQQIWEQHQYDPISQVSDYSIHFKLPKNQVLADAFTYHWRIWEIRELREVLSEAGFQKTIVLWEQVDENGEGGGEYLPTEQADGTHSHIAYVVGVRLK